MIGPAFILAVTNLVRPSDIFPIPVAAKYMPPPTKATAAPNASNPTALAVAAPPMMQLGKGILEMSAGMLAFTAGGLGLLVFMATLNKISAHAADLEKVGDAFKYINAVMSGNKDDYAQIEKTVNAI